LTAFSKSSPKRTPKVSSEELSAFELFYQLVYMSATAAAGLSRSKVFEFASQLGCRVARLFQDVDNLAQKFHYDYPTACRMVGEPCKQEDVKSFFLRFSDALESGEPTSAFLYREAMAQGEHYSNEYERDLESLKKWTDAYSSLIISEALIVIINLISTMIYDMGTALMAGLITIAVVMSFFGVWILTRAAPKEKMTVDAPAGSREQVICRRLLMILGPLAGLSMLVMVLSGAKWEWVMLVGAGLMVPVGCLSVWADTRRSKKEKEIGPFLRSLGGMATSMGTTLTEALGHIELKSFPGLQADIARLGLRLRARISPAMCWQQFGGESGSELIRQATGIFYDAISLGGDPEEAGGLSSMFATKTSLLRAKRRVVSSTFSWLTVIMHGALVLLLVLVLQIVIEFRGLIVAAIDPNVATDAMQAISVPLLQFSEGQLAFLGNVTVAMIVLLTLVNSTAIVSADGGFKLKVCFYLAVLQLISAVAFFAGPPFIQAIM
jgi:flagellar protein FlaJ